MINPLHQDVLSLIKKNSGKPGADPLVNSYFGNDHLRYPINNPTLRGIAREWMRAHKRLDGDEFKELLTSLIHGKSCTEKMTAGFLMGYSSKTQRNFDPMVFDQWLDHLAGWVEVDTLCTGDFITTRLPLDWPRWKKLIIKLSKDANINKRRASLVLFCSPLARVKDEEIAAVAFQIVERLKTEKHVLITKAVSWVLRTMIKHYRESVSVYVKENGDTLPKIALRETTVKLKTGKKTKRPARA